MRFFLHRESKFDAASFSGEPRFSGDGAKCNRRLESRCHQSSIGNQLLKKGRRQNGFPAGRASRAFTLLEVILAIAIAAGMLAVVLFFYTQAANLRVQLFYETTRTSAARLLMNRLTTELGNARRCESFDVGLKGSADSIEFVRLDLPNSSGWTNSPDALSTTPISPFRVIRYGALRSPDGTNIFGITRSEETLLRRTSEPIDEGDISSTNAIPTRRTPVPIDQFRFIRFRYWNGATWLDSWTAADLPAGVEVTLGAEPVPEGISPDDYPYEIFRRVIYIPTHGLAASDFSQDSITNSESSSSISIGSESAR